MYMAIEIEKRPMRQKHRGRIRAAELLVNGRVYVDALPGERANKNRRILRSHAVAQRQILHRLLLPNEVVHHCDHDKRNDAPENLQVMTHRQHSSIHMTERRREEWNVRGKVFTPDQIRAIRCANFRGLVTLEDIAEQYNTSVEYARAILNYEVWAWVEV